MNINTNLKLKVSIFLLWLFTISGIIGILSPTKDWFLALTPINLLLYFAVIILNIDPVNKKVVAAISIPFFLGFITEALGVNYGLIFGTYTYGNNLGFKIWGVPLLICFNWAVLTAATADIAKMVSKNLLISALIGGLLMTLLDVLLEISAPRFDFWEFKDGEVPLQNYIGWFITGFAAHLGYQNFNIKTHKIVSVNVILSIIVFFTVFVFF